jgi:ribosome-binding factor A
LRSENEPEWLEAAEVFGGPSRTDTKTIQLCRQVEEAIAYALVCSTSPILRDLYVMGVEPARGAALLRVLVTMEGDAHDYQQTVEALARAKGYFRAEVARAIHRKRVPSLEFALVPSSAGGRDE